MNAEQPSKNSTQLRRTNGDGEWRLVTGVLVAAALVLLLAGPIGSGATYGEAPFAAARASNGPAIINNHLYVPCSVSGCDRAPSVINNHLYVPCSVSGCEPTPGAINNHLYVPCSVSGCTLAPRTADHPGAGGARRGTRQ
jgi:hypothetical protein